ncbi:MAG: DUF3489 domain-containing protein [Bryobacteraceae bacterium]|jgi:hypothetical protein
MTTFTLNTENNITAFSGKPADAATGETFTSQKELGKLSADWPASRLVDVWNSFAGVTPFDDLKPVKKFTSRKGAVARIWKAVQRLSQDVAQPAAPVAPAKPRSKKSPVKGKRPVRARHGANEARDGSKKAEVIELMRRKSGATLAEIMKKTAWQSHTVRGFVSGTLVKKLGLKVDSFRTEDKERAYRIIS